MQSNGFILKRTGGEGGYVAKPGSKNSYTRVLNRIRVFPSKEAAENERCVGNEIVLPLDALY